MTLPLLSRGWTATDIPDQSGRTALVTGANSGLGLHTSLQLARAGARVLLASRDPGRGAAAVDRIRREVPDALLELVELDLASLASVREAAATVSERLDRLDVLVDNAGVMAIPRRLTADGFEMQIGTNHLGHFALTGLLLPTLLTADAPRVVVVSSFAHRTGRISIDDLHGERSYDRWAAYSQSKLANLLFVRELDRRAREAGSPLVAAAAHPGWSATNLQQGQQAPLLEIGMKVGNVVLAQSDAQGALPQLYAATMPDVRGGDYFGPRGPFELRGAPRRVGRAPAAEDDLMAALLWQRSEELTGVSYDALEG